MIELVAGNTPLFHFEVDNLEGHPFDLTGYLLRLVLRDKKDWSLVADKDNSDFDLNGVCNKLGTRKGAVEGEVGVRLDVIDTEALPASILLAEFAVLTPSGNIRHSHQFEVRVKRSLL